jgi:2-polyprenyl-3-methyl-5-hydroxy-6-metoxy-1,4-benzoquinol methylase
MRATCPLCKQDSRLHFRTRDLNREITREIFNYYRCSSCNLIFLSPIPVDLGKYYPNSYYPIPSSISELTKSAEAERYKIDIVRQFASSGRLLEIGPAYGAFIYLAKKAGFDAEAIEMDPKCCRFISETIGAKSIQSNDPSEALKNVENYNVIALWHVIEHLPDPWKTFEAISNKLQPGGILVIAAPNPDAFQFRVLGRYWPNVDAPRHLKLITLSLLTKQMLSLGLRPIWSSTTDNGTLGWNIFGWVHFFTNITNLRYIKTGLAIIGRITSIILGPIERLKGLGSAYTVVFQKEK